MTINHYFIGNGADETHHTACVSFRTRCALDPSHHGKRSRVVSLLPKRAQVFAEGMEEVVIDDLVDEACHEP